jgi:hypothetical protein
MHVNFYWTAADTLAALAGAGGAMLGLFIDKWTRRLIRR